MKNAIKAVLVTTLLGSMPAAFAASSVDFSVSGTIVPAACTPTLGTADVSFGKLSAGDLNQDSITIRPGGYRTSTLQVNCMAPTVYALRSIDNRAATIAPGLGGGGQLGLGLTPNGEKIGAHVLEVNGNGSMIDAKPAFGSMRVSANFWTPASQTVLPINVSTLLGFHDTAGATTGPVAIKDASYVLRHSLVIAPANGLSLTEEVALDGNATIEVVYL